MDGHELQPQIVSLNIDELDVEELERRLEMAIATAEEIDACGINKECGCTKLASCGTYC